MSLHSQKSPHSSHFPARRPSFRSRARKSTVAWSKPSLQTSNRKGVGVCYGTLDLTPKDSYRHSLNFRPSAPPSRASQNDKLKIVVLGGNEEVGRNMTMVEYGDDIILIDMGLQFAEYDLLGVDGIVPDISYLRGKEHRVRGIIITHMHIDHIGAIPFLLPLLPNVPIYSSPLTLAMIAKKLEYAPDVKADLRAVDEKTLLELGAFRVKFIGVSHSVPAAMGIVVETPVGKILHTGDFKIDLHPESEEAKANFEALRQLGTERVLALLADSTNAAVSGHQIMEREVEHDLDKIFADATGRLLFGMISTNVERLAQLIKSAEKHGRHVFVGGLSLKTTAEIAEQLGYLKPKPGTLIDADELKRLPAHKIVAIFPGAQGEANGAFFKLADGLHRDLHLIPGDTVVFSSSVIPGNERSVQFITDKFYRRGAKVLTYKMLDIHSGGHAHVEDLKEVIKLVKPKYLIPIEGQHAFLHAHAAAAKSIGFAPQNIFIADNGQVMEFDANGNGVLTNRRIAGKNIFVRGKQMDHVDEDTLRERKHIGEEGALIVSILHDGHAPYASVQSYGIRHKEAVEALHGEVAQKVNVLARRSVRTAADVAKLQETIEKELARFLEEKFEAKPFVAVVMG